MPQSSSAPVWSKRVGEQALAEANIRFCAGFDVAGRPPAVARLASADLQTNAAHLLMLVEQQIVPTEQGSQAAAALLQLRDRVARGEQLLDPACEDIHMSVESAVTALVGSDAGGRLHTGRSRNDQVATDMRLWLREEIASQIGEIFLLFRCIAEHAAAQRETLCPGFTHGQPAMVTSWGHWTMSYLPRLLRAAQRFVSILPTLDECPLGAAASYGTSWPLNRPRTAELLGFGRPSLSGADSIWSRGELEAQFAVAAAMLLNSLSGVAQDIILLSSPPRDWLRLSDEHVTGSSIMPQKRNPDFAEVTRSRAAVGAGIAQGLLGIGRDLPSGYNRDTQWTKYQVFDAADNAAGACLLYSSVFQKMAVNKDSMAAACRIGFLNATDVADYLARSRDVPFRTCYRILGPAVKACEAAGELQLEPLNKLLEKEGLEPLTEAEWKPLEEPAGLLRLRNQPGNPHPDQVADSLDALHGSWKAEVEKPLQARTDAWAAAERRLWELLRGLVGH